MLPIRWGHSESYRLNRRIRYVEVSVNMPGAARGKSTNPNWRMATRSDLSARNLALLVISRSLECHEAKGRWRSGRFSRRSVGFGRRIEGIIHSLRQRDGPVGLVFPYSQKQER